MPQRHCRAMLVFLLAALPWAGQPATPVSAAEDTSSVTVVGKVDVGNAPSDVAIDPVTHTVFVANQGSNTVSIIEEATRRVVATVPVGDAPVSIAVDSGAHLAYVANLESASVSVLDGVHHRIVTTLSVGYLPSAVAVDSSTHRAYVDDESTAPACYMGGCDEVIRVLDSRTFREITTRQLNGTWPYQIVVDPSTHDLVFSWDYKYEEDAGVEVLDDNLHTRGGVDPGYAVGGVAFDPRTRHIYVGELMAKLLVLTPQPGPSLTFRQTVVPIGVGVHHLALDPSTETLYVANASSHTLSVVDALTNTVTQTVPIGPPSTVYFTTEKTGPGTIGVDPATHQVYVADRGGHSVTVLQGIASEVPGAATGPAMPATGGGGGQSVRTPSDDTGSALAQRLPSPLSDEVPGFAGAAHPVLPANGCPAVLPGTMRAPFGPTTAPFTVADYQLRGCWAGSLAGQSFVLDLYASEFGGGGVAVRYGDRLVAHVLAGSGFPMVVRFTGDSACWVEQAGAWYGAINIRTGAVMPDQEAQRVCPPVPYPPPYVLGLGAARYPFPTFPAPTAASPGTAPTEPYPAPRAMPSTGGGGAA